MQNLSLSTASSIRARVVGPLTKTYDTISDALSAFGMSSKHPRKHPPSTPAPSRSQHPASPVKSSQEYVNCIMQMLENEPIETLQDVVDQLYFTLAEKKGIDTYPYGFATLSTNAMLRLQNAKKQNLVFKFAQCIANNRPGTEDPLMPLTRMPFGLIEYQILFFSSVTSAKVSYFGYILCFVVTLF